MSHFKIRLLVAPFLIIGGLWLHELVQAKKVAPDEALRRATDKPRFEQYLKKG